MTSKLRFFVSLLLLATGGSPLAGAPAVTPAEPVPVEPSVETLQESFARVAEAVKPAVVSITTVHVESVQAQPYEFYFGDPYEEFFREFFGQPPTRRAPPRPFRRQVEGMGSGVLIDPKGYILTNEHVIRGAEKLQVTLQEPEEKVFSGKVVGKDPRTDLAVVQISSREDLPYARLGDSDNVRVGDWAVAVGSPFGLNQTVTVGVVSAVRQSLDIEGRHYAGLLQTDAAINRGNSGGPLVNIRGEVVGVNTAIFAPTGVFSGIGFAIPINQAKEIMEQLIEKGRVVRGWMGVEIFPLDDMLARQFGVPDKSGVVVNHVLPGSPAEKAGLRRGDVLRSFDGRPVASQEALIGMVSKTPPRKRVKVEVWRDKKRLELSLVTAERPDEPEEGGEPEGPPPGGREAGASVAEWGGARFAAVSADLARRYGFPSDAAGVVALRTEPGGEAERIGLVEGDLVASVNGRATPDPQAFLAAARKADLKEGVVLDVNRAGRWLYLSYREED